MQPEQLASVQNLRGKVKRSKMTASSHAEIVMTMMEMAPQRRSAEPAHIGFNSFLIELLNNKLHWLSLPGGFVSPSGGFASLSYDQAVP